MKDQIDAAAGLAMDCLLDRIVSLSMELEKVQRESKERYDSWMYMYEKVKKLEAQLAFTDEVVNEA